MKVNTGLFDVLAHLYHPAAHLGLSAQTLPHFVQRDGLWLFFSFRHLYFLVLFLFFFSRPRVCLDLFPPEAVVA